ncbi:MAG: AtpZ/AtpI family protein [Acidimicrobiales bacterium]
MSRIKGLVQSQLRTPSSEGGTTRSRGMGLTDGVATAVEMFGTILLCTGLGWLAYRQFHNIVYFIALTLFGAVGTMVRLYYQAKDAFRSLDEADAVRSVRQRREPQDRGLSGFLEADLALGEDLADVARRLVAPDQQYPKEGSV